MKINEVQEDVLKKHGFWLIFHTKMGGLEVQKQAFRFICVAKYEALVFREKASNMTSNRGPQMIPNRALGAQGLDF